MIVCEAVHDPPVRANVFDSEYNEHYCTGCWNQFYNNDETTTKILTEEDHNESGTESRSNTDGSDANTGNGNDERVNSGNHSDCCGT